jgi:hypothetical protein
MLTYYFAHVWQVDQLAAATKIQTAFRRYHVRKPWNGIFKFTLEVKELKRNVIFEEAMRKMKKNKLEGLRIIERISQLLFNLDSSVRLSKCHHLILKHARKLVVDEALAFQVYLDQIQTIEEPKASEKPPSCTLVFHGYFYGGGGAAALLISHNEDKVYILQYLFI